MRTWWALVVGITLLSFCGCGGGNLSSLTGTNSALAAARMALTVTPNSTGTDATSNTTSAINPAVCRVPFGNASGSGPSANAALTACASANPKDPVVLARGSFYHLTSDLTMTNPIDSAGGGFYIDSSATLTLKSNVTAPATQLFFGPGKVSFIAPGADTVVRPEWWGAVADGSLSTPVSGTDNHNAIMAAHDALPVLSLPSQGKLLSAGGTPMRTGEILFSEGRYVVNQSLKLTASVNYDCPYYEGCTVVLKDGVAKSGPEYWVIDFQPAQVSGVGSPDATFGAQIHNLAVDCNGGAVYGTNVMASGIRFYGAQGSIIGPIKVYNCGMRGFYMLSCNQA